MWGLEFFVRGIWFLFSSVGFSSWFRPIICGDMGGGCFAEFFVTSMNLYLIMFLLIGGPTTHTKRPQSRSTRAVGSFWHNKEILPLLLWTKTDPWSSKLPCFWSFFSKVLKTRPADEKTKGYDFCPNSTVRHRLDAQGCRRREVARTDMWGRTKCLALLWGVDMAQLWHLAAGLQPQKP